MAAGRLAALDQGSGPGYVVRGAYVGRLSLGSGPGARKKEVVYVTTGVEGDYEISKAILDLGVYAGKDVKFPIRMKVLLNGATVTREFKPQFVCKGDEGSYAKAVYDVRSLAAARLKSRPQHRVSLIYDSSRIVNVDDVGLLVVYNIEESWHSYVYMAGAIGFEPGEEIVVNAKLPESKTPSKSVQVGLVVPSRFSEMEVRVGDSVRNITGIVGPVLVELPAHVEGERVRVVVDYKSGSAHVYPKVAYLTSVVVSEAIAPRANLKLSIAGVESGGDSLKIQVTLRNDGNAEPSKVILSVIVAGLPVARLEVDPLKPGESRDVTLKIDKSRLPENASTAVVRAVWNNLGRVYVSESQVSYA
ncbi:CARDB domain-containing protein [Stetteria hydrogenophila]